MPDLSVIIVSWNVRELLRTCLQSVIAETSAEIVVVDNASSDGSADMIGAEFPDVRLIANDHNAGFGAANNQALRISSRPYVLILNPDTEIKPGAIGTLLTFIERRPNVACVGPRLLNPDGSTQSSRRSFPHVTTAFVESTMLQRHVRQLPALRRFYRGDRPDDEPQKVDWLVGACLLLRRSALDEVRRWLSGERVKGPKRRPGGACG